jgi:hypothetical protein
VALLWDYSGLALPDFLESADFLHQTCRWHLPLYDLDISIKPRCAEGGLAMLGADRLASREQDEERSSRFATESLIFFLKLQSSGYAGRQVCS